MEKYLVKKNIVSCEQNAKALLGLFAVACFAMSGYLITETFIEKPIDYQNSEIKFYY